MLHDAAERGRSSARKARAERAGLRVEPLPLRQRGVHHRVGKLHERALARRGRVVAPRLGAAVVRHAAGSGAVEHEAHAVGAGLTVVAHRHGARGHANAHRLGRGGDADGRRGLGVVHVARSVDVLPNGRVEIRASEAAGDVVEPLHARRLDERGFDRLAAVVAPRAPAGKVGKPAELARRWREPRANLGELQRLGARAAQARKHDAALTSSEVGGLTRVAGQVENLTLAVHPRGEARDRVHVA